MNTIKLELVEAARTDKEALSELYAQAYPSIFGYLLRRCGERLLAEDLTSETFLKVVKHLDRYRPKPNKPFISWVFTIASNELAMYYRKENHYRFVELENFPELKSSPEDRIEDQVEADENYRILREAISKLSEIDQQIVSLRYFEDKPHAEIAELTGLKEATIRSRLSRAIDKLRPLLTLHI